MLISSARNACRRASGLSQLVAHVHFKQESSCVVLVQVESQKSHHISRKYHENDPKEHRRYFSHNSRIRLQNKSFTVIGDEAVVDRSSEQFTRNIAQWEKIVQRYRQALDISLAGAGEKAIEKHVKRHGKMLVTDRVKALVDNIDEFLELSIIAGINMEYGHVPRANLLTGIGKVMGHYCLITAFDGAFKAGAIYPITLKKQLRAHEIAQQNRLPCIFIVDSAGAFLPLQAEIFTLGGKVFYNEAVMSAAKIPQIAIVCGSCTAGGAYVPTMANEAVIVNKTGTLFLGGPPLVQAALGEIVEAEELGGANLHCSTSGCTDYFAKNEAEAFQIGRNIVASLNLSSSADLDDYDDPVYDIGDIPGILPSPHMPQSINMYQIIARLVDGSRFHEFKALYGRLLLTGFAHIQGHLVGIIANQGEINDKEAAKGAHFVQLCCERDVPLVFLQNTISDVEFSSQTKDEAMATSISLKCRARMLAAVSCAAVPKLTIIIGNSFGSGHYIMGGRAVSPNFLFAWPNAQVAMMQPEKLAQTIIKERGRPDETNEADDLKNLSEKYQMESSAIFGATRILNDGIILPQETRKILSQCLAICKAYRPKEEQNYPVFRM